ncbi:MAG: SpoIIE family protein phosphatase [Ruminococcus sp.]|nr:SpoIIE family protein phosphatase [Candidatus Copronaster equi]
MNKKSIANKITRSVSLFLVIAFTILLMVSFFVVQFVLYKKNQKYSKALTTAYSDTVVYESGKNNVPIDKEHPELAIFFGEYLCEWYTIDYCYMFVPDVQNDKVTYICIVENKDKTEQKITDNFIGKQFDYDFPEEVLEVWEEKRLFAHVIMNSDFGHEIGTIILAKDSFGNKVLVGVDTGFSEIYGQSIGFFSILALIIALVILGLYFSVYMIIQKQVSHPAQRISKTMNDFITDGERKAVKLNENNSYEYEMISNAFNSMTQNIDSYLDNIQSLTKDKERRDTELDIAARIQKGFLPQEHRVTDSCEFNALMNPARNIGGDMYDYFKIDDTHILVAVGDVSGKGISAAMFMAITFILTRQYAKMNLSPGEILRSINNILSENNAALLFATMFLGIYNSETGELSFANAGHNPPYLIGSKMAALEVQTGTPLGLFENESYQEALIKLDKGNTVFFYTDGVTETINKRKEFFAVERLEQSLKKYNYSEGKSVIAYINDEIHKFSQGAEQFDDITMMTLTVRDSVKLILDYNEAEFEKIKNAVLSIENLSRKQKLNLCLAAEECFVNICSYAFEGGAPKNEKIIVRLSVSDKIILSFEDRGQPFNPIENIQYIEDYDIDTQVGGLGRYIVVSNVDDIKYEYANKNNILTLIKYFEEENK